VGLNWLSIGCKSLEVLDLGGCNKVRKEKREVINTM